MQLLKSTNHPELFYTQFAACGQVPCPDALKPANVTPNQLISKGTRLVIINGDMTDASFGWVWPKEAVEVGYCTYNVFGAIPFNGSASPEQEQVCITYGDGGSAERIVVARPPSASWDDVDEWMQFEAVLTPAGLASDYVIQTSLESPAFLGGNPANGYDVGTDPYDFNEQLSAGSWRAQALNLVFMDDITVQNNSVPTYLIARNDQTWTNAQFPNKNFPQAAAALGVGANGDIWAAGSGHSISISKYNPNTGTWVYKIGDQPNVKKLAVDPSGGVWVVGGSYGVNAVYGTLSHYDRNGQSLSIPYSIAVRDVAVGSNGSVWAVSVSGIAFEYIGPTDGSPDIGATVPYQLAEHVAVDNKGYPWVTDNNTNVVRFTGSAWQQVGSLQGKEIVAGADGSIFLQGLTPSIGRYDAGNNTFVFEEKMDAEHIAVDSTGHPWVIHQGNGAVYKGALDQM